MPRKRPEGKARSVLSVGSRDAVLALSKAFALAAASDEAADIRDEVGFFQAIRAALVKEQEAAIFRAVIAITLLIFSILWVGYYELYTITHTTSHHWITKQRFSF